VGKPEEINSFSRHGLGWEGNIKIVVQEVGWGCGTYMPEDRDKWLVVVKMAMNPRGGGGGDLWTS
jgi:hypothetical protein